MSFVPRSMDEVHQKLSLLHYPRSSAPSQSLLYAGFERYALLDWLFFRFSSPSLLSPLLSSSLPFLTRHFAGCSVISLLSLASKAFSRRAPTVTKRRLASNLMRLADLIGYGDNIETSPCNSAALSMLPWPRPAVWPHVPPDISRLQAKEQMTTPKLSDGFGRLRKQLSLSPTVLLREANRRRSSLTVGSLAVMLDLGRLSLKESPVPDAADAAIAAVDAAAAAPLPPSTLPDELVPEADSSSPKALRFVLFMVLDKRNYQIGLATSPLASSYNPTRRWNLQPNPEWFQHVLV